MSRLTLLAYLVFLLTFVSGCTRSQQNLDKDTSLALAIGTHDLPRAKELLASGADPNERNHNGVTPLWIAVDHDDTIMVNLLLDHHADILDTSGRNSMESVGEIAAFNNSWQSLAILYKHGFSIQKRDNEGQTMLHVAVRGNNLEIAAFLLQHGLNPNTPDSIAKQTPLCIAVDIGSPAMVSLLLSNGADPNLLTDGDNPNSIGRANFSILCEVIWKDGDELSKRGGELEELRMFGDSTEKSRHERYVEIMNTLLHAGALPNFEVDRGGGLWLAARYCDLDMARILLQNGADRNAKTRDGQTPLDMAKKQKCKELEHLLTK